MTLLCMLSSAKSEVGVKLGVVN